MPGPSRSSRLPRSSRIKKRLEFEAAQSGGRRTTTAHFVFLLYARNDTNAHARLGIVASRKVGNAVVRNRAKRLVREAFRRTQRLFGPGIDVVVVVRRSLEKRKLGEVVAEWRSAATVLERRAREAGLDRRERLSGGESVRSRP